MVYVCAELNVSFHGSMAENPGEEGGGEILFSVEITLPCVSDSPE